jgi:hypothetical protein
MTTKLLKKHIAENIIGHSCTSWIGPGNPETKYRNDKIADANRNLSYIIIFVFNLKKISTFDCFEAMTRENKH